MLYRIDRRMRQITTEYNKLFGGLSIILSGDPGQLLLEHLKKRFYKPNKEEEFKDSLRIYSLNDDCAEHNKFRLNQVYAPITVLIAHNDYARGKYCGSDQFRGLQNNIYLCIGAQIVITTNILKRFGIMNGACGTVMDIIYRNTSSGLPELPFCIIINLAVYTGKPFFAEESRRNWIPFDALQAYNARSTSTRTQFPFRLERGKFHFADCKPYISSFF